MVKDICGLLYENHGLFVNEAMVKLVSKKICQSFGK